MHCKAVERIVGGKEVREKGRKGKEKSTEEAENTPENETNDTLARVYRPTSFATGLRYRIHCTSTEYDGILLSLFPFSMF